MFIIKIAVKCIIEKNGKILLIKESSHSSWRPNTWSLPGGKIDKNETFIEALHREMKEETGLKIKIKGLFRIEEIIQNVNNENKLVHHYIFIGKHTEEKLKKPDQHSAGHKWFTQNELLKFDVNNLSEYYYKDLFKDYYKHKDNIVDLKIIKIWNINKNKSFKKWCDV